VEEALVRQGYRIDKCSFGEEDVPPYQDIICLLEVESPFTRTMSPDELLTLQRILRYLGASRILWVIGSLENPEYALTLGLSRSIRAELSIPLATIQIDTLNNSKAAEAVVNVFRKFQETATAVNPDYEFILKDGMVQVGRYHWTKVSEELATLEDSPGQALRLQKKQAGGTDAFGWLPFSPPPLAPDEVQVSPAYTGLPLRGALATGTNDGDLFLGLEGAGTVIAIGSAVQTLEVGDRVMVLGSRCLETATTVSSNRLVRVPDDLSLDKAATMPMAYSTAIYCMIDVANLKRDQTVLVQSACSDVGFATIQISRMIGAEASREFNYFAETILTSAQ
jgi:hypothetical protein